MSWAEAALTMRRCAYTRLATYGADEGSGLRLVIDEMIVGDERSRIEADGALDQILGPARPILTSEGCHRFVIVFPEPVATLVLNESFDGGWLIPDEEPPGPVGSSAFLDQVSETTFAEAIVGPLRHFWFPTTNHTVHVAASIEPHVSVGRIGATDI